MPWKVVCKVEERKKFVTRLLNGDKMTDLCREFEISRKTGYKIYDRFMELGNAGLEDLSTRPRRLGNLLDSGVAEFILSLKKEKSTWGAPKLRELFIKKKPNYNPPAISTIHALLERNGLVKSRRRTINKYKAKGTYLSHPTQPNDLWCTDFKGQFGLGNKTLCYPLTITDQVSRYLFAVEGMEQICEKETKTSFRRVFKEFGLPDAIRSDNGVPFASRSFFGLSKLSVWWLRLGIKLERIVPGKPQQNGRHERMHRTLKASVTKPPAKNILSQQEKFDAFIEEFNNERPHEALDMKTPSQIYKCSKKIYPEILDEIDYSANERTANVDMMGRISFEQTRIFIGSPLAGQTLGLTEVDEGLWMVHFMDYELGYFDSQSWKFESGENPFALN
jgi:transposase InsO family protein